MVHIIGHIDQSLEPRHSNPDGRSRTRSVHRDGYHRYHSRERQTAHRREGSVSDREDRSYNSKRSSHRNRSRSRDRTKAASSSYDSDEDHSSQRKRKKHHDRDRSTSRERDKKRRRKKDKERSSRHKDKDSNDDRRSVLTGKKVCFLHDKRFNRKLTSALD